MLAAKIGVFPHSAIRRLIVRIEPLGGRFIIEDGHAGRERAKELARAFKDASDTLRTKQTAEPTLRQAKIPETVIKADGSHVDGAFKAIQGAGETAVVLYVGHSDTIEPLLRRLRYKGPVSFEDPFGNLIILMPKSESPVVVRLHY